MKTVCEIEGSAVTTTMHKKYKASVTCTRAGTGTAS